MKAENQTGTKKILLSFTILAFVLAIALASQAEAVTQYQYWRQDDNTSTVWFNVSGTFSGLRAFRIYNTSAYSENINKVFIEGDDFDDSSFNTSKWTADVGSGVTSESSGYLWINATIGQNTGGAYGVYANSAKVVNNTYAIARGKTSFLSSGNISGGSVGIAILKSRASPLDNVSEIAFNAVMSSTSAFLYSASSGLQNFSIFGSADTNLHTFRLTRTPSRIYGYVDTTSSYLDSYIYRGTMYLGMVAFAEGADVTPQHVKYDYIFMNKYLSNPPKITKSYNSAGKYWEIVVNNSAGSDLSRYALNVTGINLTGNLRIDSIPIINTPKILPSTINTSSTMKLYCNSSGTANLLEYKLYKNNVTYLQGIAFNEGSISSDGYFSCGIRANDSRVLCWGRNNHGQLGDNTTTERHIPTLTTDISAYKSILVGGEFSCGIRANDSRVLCWGYNYYGQLGHSSTTERHIPTLTTDISAYKLISTGAYHTCGIRANDSRVLCWGRNAYGQLGDNTTTERHISTPIADTSAYKLISTGAYHTCGIRANDSQVLCWGSNGNGQLGDNTTTERHIPTLTTDISKYLLTSSKNSFSCGIRANDSRVLCWGINGDGQLGDNTTTERHIPTLTTDISAYNLISTGTYHSCGIRANDSRVLCWGNNNEGQFGDGTKNYKYVPTLTTDASAYKSLSSGLGNYHTCGIRANDSRVLCWGYNQYGQLGDNTTSTRTAPTLTSDTSSYLKTSTGSINFLNLSSSYLRANDQWKLSCRATDGQVTTSWSNSTVKTVISILSANTPYILPTNVTTSSTMQMYCDSSETAVNDYRIYKNNAVYLENTVFAEKSLATGDNYYCGIRANDSRILCWGYGANGRLGNDNASNKLIPTVIASTTAFKRVEIGETFACGIRSNDSRIMCWGINTNSCLGDGTTTTRTTPVTMNVSTIEVREISSGSAFSCVIRSNDSRVYCWGSGSNGQLGYGGTTAKSIPNPINSTSSFKYISMGGAMVQYSCGIRANDSRILCWGGNTAGQLGDNTTTQRKNPTLVNSTSAFKKIELGDFHACGIRTNDSQVLCWGQNSYGKLGDGTTVAKKRPTLTTDASAYIEISAGAQHTCGIRANDSRVLCWGSNGNGQLGDNTTTERHSPTLTIDTSAFKKIECGTTSTCAIRANDSRVICWGSGSNGQLGDNTTTQHLIPKPTSDSSSYLKTSTGAINFLNLSKEYLKVGDQWKLSCRASSGTTATSWINSTLMTVYSPPSVSSVSISPTRAYTNNTLTGSCTYTGTSAHYKWYKNGILNVTGTTTRTNLTAGDAWIFSCSATNGVINSSWSNSSSKTIYGIPSIISAVITPATVYKNTTMLGTCNYTGTSNYYRWYKNGVLNESGTGSTPIKTGMLKSQSWILSCKATDGYVNSSWTNSSAKVISNLPPTTPTQTYPADLAMLNRPFTMLNWTATDQDGDVLTYYLFRNDTRIYKGSRLYFNLTGLSDATYYSWHVIASDNQSNSSNSSTRIFYTSFSKPSVTIVSPANNSWLTNMTANVTFTATDASGIDTCKLYLNNTAGTYGLNQTKTAVISGANSYFYATLISNRTYKAGIWCNDSYGTGSWSLANLTFRTDNKAPRMTVSAPLNGTTYYTTTTSVTMSATDYYAVSCSFALLYKPTMTVRSTGSLNCTGTTVVSTPTYSSGYVLNITASDLAGNTNTTQRYITATTAPVVTPSGSGSGGGISNVKPKRTCDIVVNKQVSFYKEGVAEIVIVNKDNTTYKPSLSLTNINGIPSNSIQLTNVVQSILPNTQTSFGVKFNDSSVKNGNFTVVLTDTVCSDIQILGTAGTEGNQVDIFAQLITGDVTALATSPINYDFTPLKVWMLFGVIFLTGLAFSLTTLWKLMRQGEIIVVIAWVVVLALVCGAVTIAITYGSRTW